jgi:uncharacterized protein (UPF0218 family)
MTDGVPINDQLRADLKLPLGRVVPDAEVSSAVIAPYFDGTHMTVAVGDRTTERIHEMGLSPNLEVVDSLEKRKSRVVPKLDEKRRQVHATNPPGAISSESMMKLAECLKLLVAGEKVRLEIVGEEDLLAVPVIAFFPPNSVTFYGQPNVGMVVVNSDESRARSQVILREMGFESLPPG